MIGGEENMEEESGDPEVEEQETELLIRKDDIVIKDETEFMKFSFLERFPPIITYHMI